ncbi:MAG: hypothetical protein NT018_08285 [Armatimonadetes bacterium]|nr:hypothetical protein [Armatimonadota bacterium]
MKYLYFAIVFLVALAGCGGGGGHRDPLNITGSAELTLADNENVDDSLYESQSFEATRNGWVQVTMSSTDLDPYILVYSGTDENNEVGHDDDSGTSQNSVFFFSAEKDHTYTVKFTTYGSGAKTGHYTFTIKEVTGPDTKNQAIMLNSAKPIQDPAMKRSK